MNRRRVLKHIFGVCTVYTVGLYPIDGLISSSSQDIDYYRNIRPNSAQISFLRRLSENYDFVCLGDKDHASPEIHMFASHPDTVSAIALPHKRHFFLERSPNFDNLFSEELTNSAFLEQCSEMRYSWVSDDNYYQAFCENLRLSIEQSGTRFVAIDQRRADGTGPYEKGSWFQRASSLPLRLSFRLQEAIYGKVSLISPSTFLSGLPSLINGQISNDTNTVEAIIDRAPGGGNIFFGASHFDDNRNWIFERYDMPHLLREAGFSVCVINIHMGSDHYPSWFLDDESDAQLEINVSDIGENGIIIKNSDLQGFLNDGMPETPEANFD